MLLLAHSHNEADHEACIELLTRDGPRAANVLSVTLEATPDERLAVWQREVGEVLPKRAMVLDAGSGASESTQTVASDEFPTIDVDTLPADAELIDIGMSIASKLGEWRETDDRTVLCLHSLSALLDTFETDRVIGLVNGLNDLCDRHDVIAHHHVDPRDCGDEMLAVLRPLYDTVVEHVSGGGWTVSMSDSSDLEPSFRATTAPPGGVAKIDPERPEAVPMPYSFDTVIDLISEPRRRTVLYHLKYCVDESIDLEQLASRVHERERSIPVRQPAESQEALLANLAHAHLPKLDELGVIRYDADERVVHYHANRGLEACVQYVETLELG